MPDATTGSKRFAPALVGASWCFPCLRARGCRRVKEEGRQVSVGLGDRFGDAAAAEPAAETQEGAEPRQASAHRALGIPAAAPSARQTRIILMTDGEDGEEPTQPRGQSRQTAGGLASRFGVSPRRHCWHPSSA